MMKRLLGLGLLLAALFASPALAQCTGTPNANNVCAGPSSGAAGFPAFRPMAPQDMTSGITPSGRLSLVASTCIFTTDQVAATVIFYPTNCSPTGGLSSIPIYDGTLMVPRVYAASDTDTAGLSLTLGANWAANTLYDVFATLSGGAPVLCTVAWANSTAGSSSRGTGVNTAEIQAFRGIPTNKNSLNNCRNSNASVLTVAANQATKLGTFLTSSVAGQVNFKFGTRAAGGGAACICLYNDFNQTIGQSIVGDTTASWTYQTNAFRQADGSAGNQIVVLQGAPGSIFSAIAQAFTVNSLATSVGVSGIGIDSTTVNSANVTAQAVTANTGAGITAQARLQVNLAVGLHNINWLESGDGTGTETWFGQTSFGFPGLTATFLY